MVTQLRVKYGRRDLYLIDPLERLLSSSPCAILMVSYASLSRYSLKTGWDINCRLGDLLSHFLFQAKAIESGERSWFTTYNFDDTICNFDVLKVLSFRLFI